MPPTATAPSTNGLTRRPSTSPPNLIAQIGLVFGRSVRRGRREPAMAFVFPVAFPLLMVGLFSQVYTRVAAVPDFPAPDYLTWMAPGAFLMAAMFGAGHSVVGLIEDANNGYLDRLRLTPIRPAALMLGRLTFDVARVTVAGLVVLAAVALLGVEVTLDPAALVLLVVLLALWTLAYGGLYYVVGLKARSPEALTALVPLFLPISLLSTAYIPRDLLPGWVQSVTWFNPYSRVVDGVRGLLAGDATAGVLAAAIISTSVVIALTQIGAARRFAAAVGAD